MRRHGLTLLEVIVSLALVVALTALAMPSLAGRLGAARADSVSRDLRSSVARVRGDAVRDAQSWRILLAPDEASLGTTSPRWRLLARAFKPASALTPEAPTRFVGPIFDDVETTPGVPEIIPDRPLMDLPRGTSVSREPPTAPDALDAVGGPVSAGGGVVGDDQAGSPALGGLGDRADSLGLTLGVLLPTGAAVAGAPLYVTLPDGDVLVVSLDPWAGAARVEAWKPPEEDLDPWSDQPAGSDDGESSTSGLGRSASRPGGSTPAGSPSTPGGRP